MRVEDDYSGWYHRMYPRLLVTVTAFTGNPEVAQDAVADAFVRAWEKWPRLSSATNVDGWVYRTACNQARRRAARMTTERRLLRLVSASVATTVPPPDPSPELWQLLGRLSPRQRQVVTLRYIADLTEAETADILRIKRGTVAATLHTALARLREILMSEGKNRGTVG